MSKNFAAQTFTETERLRNFCIIAHIDHGKSTLADRILQLSNVVDARDMRDQYLDNMDIERERGITIKAQSVRLPWVPTSGPHKGEEIVLQMNDTPGHVDFTYEVSRALDACEAAILLVDAAQGIEAQTLANLYLAMEHELEIIPVLNKIDLPAADPEKYALELANIIGCEPEDVLHVSGKTGEGVVELLDKVVELTPPPHTDYPDLRLCLRRLPWCRYLYQGGRWPVEATAKSTHDEYRDRPGNSGYGHRFAKANLL